MASSRLRCGLRCVFVFLLAALVLFVQESFERGFRRNLGSCLWHISRPLPGKAALPDCANFGGIRSAKTDSRRSAPAEWLFAEGAQSVSTASNGRSGAGRAA